LRDEIAARLRGAGAEVVVDAPLAGRTWWGVGGAADLLVTASRAEVVARALEIAAEAALPVTPLGNASNLLISDDGVRGVVLVLAGELADAARDGDLLHVGGGADLVRLLRQADRAGWPGLGPLAGVPGTMGGAVVMNAGTHLGEVADILVDVDVALPGGARATLPASALALRYRSSTLPNGAVVLGATVRCAGDVEEGRQKIREHLAYRAATQPTHQRSCGSTFRNPPGTSAGRLIEACGLKGFTIGAAQVSPKHANFVVNLGGATAAELRAVVEHVRRVVAEREGVVLTPEVHLAGAWDTGWDDGQPSSSTRN
jgi:UDP-N-acetylmuramate dehydrogenase